MASKKIRLIFNEIEEHVVVAHGDPVVLDAYRGDDVSLTFYWRGKTSYTISLPLLSETIKKTIYPEKEAQ